MQNVQRKYEQYDNITAVSNFFEHTDSILVRMNLGSNMGQSQGSQILDKKNLENIMSALYLSVFTLAVLIYSLCDAYKTPMLSTKYKFPIFRSTLDNKAEVESENVLKITDIALKQLKASSQTGQCLRIGVKSGGCSGLSYSMDFVDLDKISDSDHIEMIGDLKTIIDPKSLLYIYGLELDYSTDLIGGGFKFINPNAKR